MTTDGSARKGRPINPDASEESVRRRERRYAEGARKRASAEASADGPAGAPSAPGRSGASLPPAEFAVFLGMLDDDVLKAAGAVTVLGERILPVALVAAVLEDELGRERGRAVMAKIQEAADRERSDAGIEGPDVVPVSSVQQLMSRVSRTVAALRAGGPAALGEPEEPWWERTAGTR